LIIHYDGFDFQYIVALDKESGKTVWKRDRDIDYQTTNGDLKKAYCTPTLIEVDGKPQLVSPAAKATIAYEPRTGEAIWKVRYQQHSATARPLYAFGLVFLSTGFPKAELWAVRPDGKGDITESHVAWRAIKQIGSKPSQIIVGDLISVVHDGGVVSCLDAKTGKEVWTARFDGKYSSSPLYADGHIYFFNHEGKATVIKPGREFKKVAVNQLDDGFMASPAVTGKALILRTISHLYRIEK
jgi:outer membrane protein assembly factor BamB